MFKILLLERKKLFYHKFRLYGTRFLDTTVENSPRTNIPTGMVD